MSTDDVQPGPASYVGTATLRLTMLLADHTVRVDGDVPNYDAALAMLQQAIRHFEYLLRKQQALQMQVEIRSELEARQLADALKRGKI